MIGESAALEYQHLVWSYITNIERLGIARPDDTYFTQDSTYRPLEESNQVEAFDAMIADPNAAAERAGGPSMLEVEGESSPIPVFPQLAKRVERPRLLVTPFGEQFVRACVRRPERRVAVEDPD